MMKTMLDIKQNKEKFVIRKIFSRFDRNQSIKNKIYENKCYYKKSIYFPSNILVNIGKFFSFLSDILVKIRNFFYVKLRKFKRKKGKFIFVRLRKFKRNKGKFIYRNFGYKSDKIKKKFSRILEFFIFKNLKIDIMDIEGEPLKNTPNNLEFKFECIMFNFYSKSLNIKYYPNFFNLILLTIYLLFLVVCSLFIIFLICYIFKLILCTLSLINWFIVVLSSFIVVIINVFNFIYGSLNNYFIYDFFCLHNYSLIPHSLFKYFEPNFFIQTFNIKFFEYDFFSNISKNILDYFSNIFELKFLAIQTGESALVYINNNPSENLLGNLYYASSNNDPTRESRLQIANSNNYPNRGSRPQIPYSDHYPSRESRLIVIANSDNHPNRGSRPQIPYSNHLTRGSRLQIPYSNLHPSRWSNIQIAPLNDNSSGGYSIQSSNRPGRSTGGNEGCLVDILNNKSSADVKGQYTTLLSKKLNDLMYYHNAYLHQIDNLKIRYPELKIMITNYSCIYLTDINNLISNNLGDIKWSRQPGCPIYPELAYWLNTTSEAHVKLHISATDIIRAYNKFEEDLSFAEGNKDLDGFLQEVRSEHIKFINENLNPSALQDQFNNKGLNFLMENRIKRR